MASHERGAKKFSFTRIEKRCLMIWAVLLVPLLIFFSFGEKDQQEVKNQNKEDYVTSQSAEEVEVEKPVLSRARSQVVITSETQQIDPKVAERLQAFGFSTQFATIRTTEKGGK